ATGGGANSSEPPGAAAIGGPTPGTVEGLDDVTWFTPAAIDATEDLPAGYAEKCATTVANSDVRRCDFGDPNADTVLALVGDSKIMQWESAIRQVADDNGWRVVTFYKSACAFQGAMVVADGAPYTACAEWNERALADVLDLKPDLVLTSHVKNTALADPDNVRSAKRQVLVDALVERWQELEDAGIPVAVILDNPNPQSSIYECVAENPDDLAACTFDRKKGLAYSGAPALAAAAAEMDDVPVIDLNAWICPEEQCVPVIGNVLIYRQTSHLTDTYVRSLAPRLAGQLVPIVEETGRD
ncbi:SGNH hydrolase domain-containing protein, partial [Nocardioides sp. AE5]|uniref:SGNH hydrolase domain-containing protein n=1 Tax=Nocardioides sp. AE5 TaxID=2962573 RepID=UPI002880CF07